MRNPGKLQNAVSHHRFRRWLRARAVPARVPVSSKEGREWEMEVVALERVLREVAESLQSSTKTLDASIREIDAALADIAEQKKQSEVLRRELGIGR
jgi:hypothetical protein